MKSLPASAQAGEQPRPEETRLPPLVNGERLDQKTFHARYEAMPKHVRAELIGGIVHMPSPLKFPHARMHGRVMHWLCEYEDATPGTEVYDNATAILGEESEPQPDAYLIISPEKGGQTRMNEEEYLEGAPELIVEVALSSEPVDLHAKKDDYEGAGAREYMVIALRQNRVFWFVSRNGRFEELAPGSEGIYRSEVFPGLWLDPAALLRRDAARIREVLQQGLASPEHTAFVAQLAAR
ncbi:MAG TPA: Uma2 family endonuclease [Gemmataceae bacterium]|jgi:Uma2 family endonuclease